MSHTFYIDVTLGVNENYKRLQKDGSYRSLAKPQPGPYDQHFDSVYEVIRFQQPVKKITIDGKECRVNAAASSVNNENQLFCSIYVDRDYFPLTPSKDQMVSVLKSGNDAFCNSLILNIYGLFELRDFRTLKPFFTDPTIVVRNVTFLSNNGYVGHKAALDTIFINNTYKDMLRLWFAYLGTGRGGHYSHGWTEGSETEIIADIEKLRKAFTVTEADF